MSKINLNNLDFYLENDENFVSKEKIKRKKPKNGKEDNIYKGNNNPKQQKSKNNEQE